MIFRDRDHAGELLAQALSARDFNRPVVYALPRGGVPVARHVARALKAPLDLLFVRKIGVPWLSEVAAAAVADGGRPEIVFNEAIMAASRLTHNAIEQLAVLELHEIDRRRRLYMGGRIAPEVQGRDAIIVDDGIATGATFRAAIQAIRQRDPARIIAATPVASPEVLADLSGLTDEIVCLSTPENLRAVSAHYLNFPQLKDQDVIRLLAEDAVNQPALASLASERQLACLVDAGQSPVRSEAESVLIEELKTSAGFHQTLE